MNRRLQLKLSGLTVLLVLFWFEQPQAQGGKTNRFDETTSVVVVEVPVQVTVDGEPLRGLTAANFELQDGRKKQQLVGFEAYDLSLIAQGEGDLLEAHQVPISARRHFLLLFDLSFAHPGSVSKSRAAARDLVKNSMHPSDLVAVATYSIRDDAELVLGFTPDREQVDAAIDSLGVFNPAELIRDPLNLMLAELSQSVRQDVQSEAAGGTSNTREADWLDQVRQLSILTNKATRAAQVQQVTALTNSLQDLATMMTHVQGRKHVLYLSEGFDASIILGTSGTTVEEQQQIIDTNRAAASGVYQEVDSNQRFGNSSALSAMNDVIEAFRRSDSTVHSIDIGGLRAGGDATAGAGSSADAASRAAGEQGLFYLANETGGELFRNYNNLGDAMGEMLDRTSLTYVLSFQPKELAMDGSFHPIKVKLKDVPRGARAAFRPGYYAPKPFREQTPGERTLQSAGIVLGGAEGGPIGTDVLVAPFRTAGTKAYVPVLIEIDGPDLLAGQTAGKVPAEIYAYAIRETGEIDDFFSQAMAIDLERFGGALSQSGFKFWGDFELDPGRYLIRVLVRNSATGKFTVQSTDLEVPLYSSQQALLQPFFPEEKGKWLKGKETSTRQQSEYDYPFVMQGSSFVPAVRPEIPAGLSSTLCLVGFNFGGEPEVEGLLSGAAGEELERFAVTLQSDQSSAGTERWIGRFEIASDTPAGDYRLELLTRDATGGEIRSAPLEVAVRR